MENGSNPIVPTVWEGLPIAILILGLLLTVNAVVAIVRSEDLTSSARTLWVIFAVLVPIVGAVAWFLYNRLTLVGNR